jgi:hypothetical protein
MSAMNDDEIARRKKLSFKQAEGLAPLPRQLARTEMSDELRAVLWNFVHDQISKHTHEHGYRVFGPWLSVLKAAHVFRDHRPIDDFDPRMSHVIPRVKNLFMQGSYVEVYDWLQFVMKYLKDESFSRSIESILSYCRAPYRVVEQFVIFPTASEEDAATIKAAFADLENAGLEGAREHLKTAVQHVSGGNYADMRESIHAVESVAKTLEPSAELSKALAKLEGSASIHGGLKKAFLAIYGYTSDEKGIRHALIDDANAKVDEADALFMIGACAAFVSYLINKSRSAGLLK